MILQITKVTHIAPAASILCTYVRSVRHKLLVQYVRSLCRAYRASTWLRTALYCSRLVYAVRVPVVYRLK